MSVDELIMVVAADKLQMAVAVELIMAVAADKVKIMMTAGSFSFVEYLFQK